jgi:hypothetical protein
MSISTAQLVDEPNSEQPGRILATDSITVPLRGSSSMRAVEMLEEASTVPRQGPIGLLDVPTSVPTRLERLRPVFQRWPVPREFFVALQRWEGYVESVAEETFLARLVDLAGQLPEEVAEFFLSDVSDGDRGLLQPGAVFYWSVGYRLSSTRRRSKVSLLRFRRLPRWSDRDIERVRVETERMLESLTE